MDFDYVFKKIFNLFIFREKGREGKRGGEKHQTGDLADNPGMCPDWESNQ